MGEAVGVIAVSGGFIVALVAIIGGLAREQSRLKEREKSRREIAAYVAEGNITAEEGERLMNAGEHPKAT